MNSRPARSASWHMATISSQFACQRSGAMLMVRPPSQLALNTPSLKRFGPRIGLVWRCSIMTTGCSDSEPGPEVFLALELAARPIEHGASGLEHDDAACQL